MCNNTFLTNKTKSPKQWKRLYDFCMSVQKSIYAKHQNKSKLRMTVLMVCWVSLTVKTLAG